MKIASVLCLFFFPRWRLACVLLLFCPIVSNGASLIGSLKRHYNEDNATNASGDGNGNLHLKRNSGTQFLGSGIIKDSDGNEYSLSQLKPYVGLFSKKHYERSTNEDEVIDIRSGETMPIAIFRANYDGGTLIQVEKGRDGQIMHAEIRRPRGLPDMFLVRKQKSVNKHEPGKDDLNDVFGADDANDKSDVTDVTDGTDEEPEDSFLTFTAYDLDDDYIRASFNYGDIDGNDIQAAAMDREFDFFSLSLPDFRYIRGDGRSDECTFFKVVNIAIVYDAEFCQIYGSSDAARRRIMTIVSSASVVYERDLCVKLELTDIYSPDTCSTNPFSETTSFFETFPRNTACGQRSTDTFLAAFGEWMEAARDSIGIDSDSAVHMFTGYPPETTIGCAWLGTLCNSELSYGVEYLSFTANIQTQSVVLAHELGHNLNASHLPRSDTYKHVMEPSLSIPEDGFSQISINQILSFLDAPEIQCDDVEFQQLSPSAPSGTMRNPTQLPTNQPTKFPTSQPTNLPTSSPTTMCTIQQGPPLLASPICVLPADEHRNYACFEASLLMPAQLMGPSSSSCMMDNPPPITTNIIDCDGGLNFGSVIQKQERKKSKKKGGGRVGRGNDSLFSSKDLPEEIETDNRCSEGCVMLSDFICFLASTATNDDETIYELTYEASSTDTGIIPSTTLTTNVRILGDGSGDCHNTFTRCVR